MASAIDVRATPAQPWAPRPALAVALLGLTVLQGFHEAEHVIQVVQRFVLNIPGGNGVLGHVFDVEPLHLAYNLAFFWLVIYVYRLSGATSPASWPHGMTAWWLLSIGMGIQGYHVVEHLAKIAQFIDTGRNGTPGILGQGFSIVWLHFTFNTVTYLLMVGGAAVGGLYADLGRDLRAAWHELVGRSSSDQSGRGAVLSRRTVLGGTLGIAAAVGLARISVAARSPTLQVPTFTDVTKRAGITFRHVANKRADAVQAGVAFFDFDGDGRPDIFLTNAGGPNALYRNNGDGTFTEMAERAGVADPDGVSIGVACADYDNDGRCDLLVTRLGGLTLYRNNGDGTFTDVTTRAQLAVRVGHAASAAWADFDGDGRLDLYVTYWLDEMPIIPLDASKDQLTEMYKGLVRSHRFYRNNGDGTFTEVSDVLGPNREHGAGLAVGFFDYDDDGRTDLYVVNDFGQYVRPNLLFHNDGPAGRGWSFSEVGRLAKVDAGFHGMGVAFGDYDGDGRLDLYVTNMGPNVLYKNRGNGSFEDVTNRAGVGRGIVLGEDSVGWGTAFLDFDNDGGLDLYMVAGRLVPEYQSNGQLVADQPNALFHNRGDGSFRDVSKLTLTDHQGCARGLAMADVDGDGFLDLMIANYDQPPALLKNAGNGNGWLQVRLVGTKSNRDGIGARLTLTAGGRQQVREICSGTSFLSQHSLVAHFGLGRAARVDRLEIRWPSGIVQTLSNPAINRMMTVTEPV